MRKEDWISDVTAQDPEISSAIFKELGRQTHKIELIASENFTSLAVMQAQGTWLTNKYAEGLPGKRYYGGCEYVDEVETLAIERVKELYGADAANVQPHSGANANNAVYFAMLKPGDTILGLSLSHGGHLSHGCPVNISGTYYNAIAYGVDEETETIDYEEMERLAIEHKPKMIVGGASAYARTIDFKRMADIAKKVDAIFFVDMAHIAGLVATGLHPSPVPHADIVTSTTHKSLRGPRGGIILCKEEHAKAINKAVFPGTQGGPLMHVIAAKAVAFGEALQPAFKDYQEQVIKNAQVLAKRFMENGVRIVSGGTDNHLMLVDLSPFNLTGKEIEETLDSVGITLNKNTIPKETQSPFVTSGLRIGTPAVTSQGMKEPEMIEIAECITDIIKNPQDESVKENVRKRVQTLCKAHPMYPSLVE